MDKPYKCVQCGVELTADEFVGGGHAMPDVDDDGEVCGQYLCGPVQIDTEWATIHISAASARISKLEAELAQRTADTNAMVGNCEARIAELEAQNQKFINHISFLQDKVAEYASALAAANAEIERLTAELSPLGLPAPYILRQTDNKK